MGYKNTDPCIEKAYTDERLFVLMARDPEAPRTIIHWISRSLSTQPPEKLHEALEAVREMMRTCDTFRKRRETEKRERDEFEQRKKQREGMTVKNVVSGPGHTHITDNERTVGNYEEALLKASALEVPFTRNFANWLDAQGTQIKWSVDEPHGFAKLCDEFIKSIPNR